MSYAENLRQLELFQQEMEQQELDLFSLWTRADVHGIACCVSRGVLIQFLSDEGLGDKNKVAKVIRQRFHITKEKWPCWAVNGRRSDDQLVLGDDAAKVVKRFLVPEVSKWGHSLLVQKIKGVREVIATNPDQALGRMMRGYDVVRELSFKELEGVYSA